MQEKTKISRYSGIQQSCPQAPQAVFAIHVLVLRRYGDALHPWADLVTMARSLCLMGGDEEARMIVGVPLAKTDTLVFNAYR